MLPPTLKAALKVINSSTSLSASFTSIIERIRCKRANPLRFLKRRKLIRRSGFDRPIAPDGNTPASGTWCRPYVLTELGRQALREEGVAIRGGVKCPFCGRLSSRLASWHVVDSHRPGNTAELEEWQCANPECDNRSFFI